MREAGRARRILCATPDRSAPALERLAAEAGVELSWQGPGDLGQRMERVLARAHQQRATGVIIGADSPDLPTELVEEAFEALREPGMVIGPSLDGGYYLIGCAGVVPSIFNHGPIWGGPEVFARTMDAVRGLGVTCHVLPPWDDVDDVEGLRRLAQRLRLRASHENGCDWPACRRLFAALSDEGVVL